MQLEQAITHLVQPPTKDKANYSSNLHRLTCTRDKELLKKCPWTTDSSSQLTQKSQDTFTKESNLPIQLPSLSLSHWATTLSHWATKIAQ